MKKIINIWPEISETTCKGIKPKKKKRQKFSFESDKLMERLIKIIREKTYC